MFYRILARQLRNPKGFIGKWVSLWMNKGNVTINGVAFELARNHKGGGRFLEVGFGGGGLLEMALTDRRFTCLYGIDASSDMVALAKKKFRKHVRSERLVIQEGDIVQMDLKSGSFDVAVSLNTVYFWPSLHAGILELRRVLASGGMVIIGFDDKKTMSEWPGHRFGFSMYEVEDVWKALSDHGFVQMDVFHGRTEQWGPFYCVYGKKSEK